MDIISELFALADEKYAEFQAKLTPTVDKELFIGVRVPEVRKLAKTIYKAGEYEDFLKDLPHKYYDENMLHGLIISEIKDYDKALEEVDRFLPYVDNWAVCDIMSPKVFKKHKDDLIEQIIRWSKSELVYTSRFGVEMLMSHYLDEDFKAEYLEIPAKVKLDGYYAKMMVAWFYATALAKQWDATLPYIEKQKLEPWTHNKTIQKAKESYRITPEQKEYLQSLKVKKQ
ncbi:MAG: DNA alkylation repair protein [Clostridia bacterium]|nr:DNA alkylation repair protein [Clostridia bacterium]